MCSAVRRTDLGGSFAECCSPNEAVRASSGRSAAALSAQDGANLTLRFSAVQTTTENCLRWSERYESAELDPSEYLL